VKVTLPMEWASILGLTNLFIALNLKAKS
jgi:hypothetical protein